MTTLILFAALQGYISIPPIHVLQPYPDVKCPHGYSVWWPKGKEFDNDRYAECIKPTARRVKPIVTPAAKKERLASSWASKPAPKNSPSPVKIHSMRDVSSRGQSR
jgi:hypothetical protein